MLVVVVGAVAVVVAAVTVGSSVSLEISSFRAMRLWNPLGGDLVLVLVIQIPPCVVVDTGVNAVEVAVKSSRRSLVTIIVS